MTEVGLTFAPSAPQQFWGIMLRTAFCIGSHELLKGFLASRAKSLNPSACIFIIRKRRTTATLSASSRCAGFTTPQVKGSFLVFHLRLRSTGSTGGIGLPALLTLN